ncbi:MAG: thioredoxin family protein [Cryobacterium sp.]|uniref:thioredoxin family protein n=1 Tax=unclassified Cryobacterium TaxID=2649013 RepID=UPI0018CADAD8|nr:MULTISPECIES: thioredoxin family protein [unclassified Cryobacterium]MCY7403504.1 thioredoxin family protein [Cryobacterium sp.]MEC5155360.1 hypothetical protein [Cryobacterium sp. CAN_C3]
MKIEILHIGDCPNWQEAGERARSALTQAGLSDATIEYRLLSSPEDAAQVSFAGSPTILIDGIDAFPGAVPTTDLACRISVTHSGLAGLPTTDRLRAAFTEATTRDGQR